MRFDWDLDATVSERSTTASADVAGVYAFDGSTCRHPLTFGSRATRLWPARKPSNWALVRARFVVPFRSYSSSCEWTARRFGSLGTGSSSMRSYELEAAPSTGPNTGSASIHGC